jgi:Tol biopolymer transport system component
MQQRNNLLYIGLNVISVVATFVFAMHGDAQEPPDRAVILFESDRSNNEEIWVMDDDGQNQKKITKDSGRDLSPSWSPDGARIVFASNRGEHWEHIYIMNSDGKDAQKLTAGVRDLTPSWSPDGQWIAFVHANVNEGWNFDIWVVGAPEGKFDSWEIVEFGNQKETFRVTKHKDQDMEPTWSPDGKKIAWSSSRDGNFEIYSMDANGENQKRLTNDPDDDKNPAWQTKSGQKIAFSATRDFNNEIYVIDAADGANPTNLTNDFGWDDYPAWSPDGTRIAFASLRDDNGEIYVMDLDGGNPTNLTNNEAFDAYPAWFDPQVAFSVSPKSKRLATWGNIKQVGKDEHLESEK